MKIKIKQITTLIIFYSYFFITKITNAQIIRPGSPEDTGYRTGDYELNDIIIIVVRISELILRLVGSLALLFFIYGGVMFLISSGNKEQISKAKGILKASAIGLIIVFASFVIIQLVLRALGVEGAENWQGGRIL